MVNKISKILAVFAIFAFAIWSAGCGGAETKNTAAESKPQKEIFVSAAASLTDVMKEI